jgi:hypothetical protein
MRLRCLVRRRKLQDELGTAIAGRWCQHETPAVHLGHLPRDGEARAASRHSQDEGRDLVLLPVSSRAALHHAFERVRRRRQGAARQGGAAADSYRHEWGGQYTHQQTALRQLGILVPIAILAGYLLFFAAFRRVRQAALVMANVPFALVGGVAALGIAALNDVVMVTSINDLRQHDRPSLEAIIEGALSRSDWRTRHLDDADVSGAARIVADGGTVLPGPSRQLPDGSRARAGQDRPTFDLWRRS